MKRFLCLLAAFLILFPAVALSHDDTGIEGHTVTVTARLLNGRMTPSKQAIKVGFFDRGDTLELTGRWSNDHDWIEVVGGDSGACWVARQFVNELSEPITVINNDYKKIKIRKKPYEKSKVTGYLRRGREIEITQVLLGWGKCKLGWIDLYYVQEED